MGPDLLLGLDTLKTHQACIDLEKNVLRIRGREVEFLAEHELPKKVRMPEVDQDRESGSQISGSGSSDSLTLTGKNQGPPSPGQENALGMSEDTSRETLTTVGTTANQTVSYFEMPRIEH